MSVWVLIIAFSTSSGTALTQVSDFGSRLECQQAALVVKAELTRDLQFGHVRLACVARTKVAL